MIHLIISLRGIGRGLPVLGFNFLYLRKPIGITVAKRASTALKKTHRYDDGEVGEGGGGSVDGIFSIGIKKPFHNEDVPVDWMFSIGIKKPFHNEDVPGSTIVLLNRFEFLTT